MKNILLVTNDQALFAGLYPGLTNLGFCVTTLADPTAVVNAAAAGKPDLVMMDFILEELNGGALCHQLKTDPKTQYIPVFLLSGFTGLEKLAVKFGSDALIDKRQPYAELVENILSLIHDELSIYA
ncbi:response regulator [Mucilaginibacter corticis]|uniref:Response regulator n=1 Tax=Mucilaginibacter corticis TaxID=2597670 RepID=A0A556MM90_9SPHI|nr:response regulator [Mucilaginibacter corticis]TSJ41030.1 response regulator [Mucilaginibacter corticis]